MSQASLDHKEEVMTAERDWDHEVLVHPATGQVSDKTCNEQQTE